MGNIYRNLVVIILSYAIIHALVSCDETEHNLVDDPVKPQEQFSLYIDSKKAGRVLYQDAYNFGQNQKVTGIFLHVPTTSPCQKIDNISYFFHVPMQKKNGKIVQTTLQRAFQREFAIAATAIDSINRYLETCYENQRTHCGRLALRFDLICEQNGKKIHYPEFYQNIYFE